MSYFQCPNCLLELATLGQFHIHKRDMCHSRGIVIPITNGSVTSFGNKEYLVNRVGDCIVLTEYKLKVINSEAQYEVQLDQVELRPLRSDTEPELIPVQVPIPTPAPVQVPTPIPVRAPTPVQTNRTRESMMTTYAPVSGFSKPSRWIQCEPGRASPMTLYTTDWIIKTISKNQNVIETVSSDGFTNYDILHHGNNH